MLIHRPLPDKPAGEGVSTHPNRAYNTPAMNPVPICTPQNVREPADHLRYNSFVLGG